MIFDSEKYLDRAEKEFLLSQKNIMVYSVRYNKSIRKNYSRFEKAVQNHPTFHIHSYRDKRDGQTRVGWIDKIAITDFKLLKERPHLKKIRELWDQACKNTDLFDVKDFIKTYFAKCLKKPKALVYVVKTIDFLILYQDKLKGLYPRQIPHGQSTKLIGKEPLLLSLYSFYLKEKKLPKPSTGMSWEYFYHSFGIKSKPTRFEFLTPKACYDGIELHDLHAFLTDQNISRWSFAKNIKVLIVENEESFFPLREILSDYLIILGSGRMVAKASFLETVFENHKMYYWGDIDKDGYEIYQLAHDIFQHIQPVLMDSNTISRYRHLVQRQAPSKPSKNKIAHLQKEYEQVCKEGILIEQEQISLDDVRDVL